MVNAMIVSACVGCVSIRLDPPQRFYRPAGSGSPDGCHWFGDCPACGRATRHDVLGVRAAADALLALLDEEGFEQ